MADVEITRFAALGDLWRGLLCGHRIARTAPQACSGRLRSVFFPRPALSLRAEPWHRLVLLVHASCPPLPLFTSVFPL